MDFNVIKSKNPIDDFDKLVNVLDAKFKFKNKLKFMNDLLDLISTIKINSVNETDKFTDKFFFILKDNSSEPEIDKQAMNSIEEIKNINEAFNKWQTRKK